MSKQPVVNPRRRNLLFAFFMSGLMSLLMSGVITLINTGVDMGFVWRWMNAFFVAWGVAFPLLSFIAPLAHRMTDGVFGLLYRAKKKEESTSGKS